MYVLEMMNITYVPTRIKVLELLYLLIESDPIILHTFARLFSSTQVVAMAFAVDHWMQGIKPTCHYLFVIKLYIYTYVIFSNIS